MAITECFLCRTDTEHNVAVV